MASSFLEINIIVYMWPFSSFVKDSLKSIQCIEEKKCHDIAKVLIQRKSLHYLSIYIYLFISIPWHAINTADKPVYFIM